MEISGETPVLPPLAPKMDLRPNGWPWCQGCSGPGGDVTCLRARSRISMEACLRSASPLPMVNGNWPVRRAGLPIFPREGIDDMLAIMMKMAKVVDKDGDPKYGLHAFRRFLRG